MSRLIVKNLPTDIKESKLRKLFEEYGKITDIKLMFTKAGKFRRFGFVGYKQLEEAEKAKHFLDKSLILNQKINVELCRDFGLDSSAKASHKPEPTTTSKVEDEQKNNNSKLVSDSDFLQSKMGDDLKDDEGIHSDEDHDMESNKAKSYKTKYILRLRGCPFSITKKQVVEFFYPIKPSNINIQKNSQGSRTGNVLVEFSSQKDTSLGLNHNGDYIGGRYIEIFKIDSETRGAKPDKEKAWVKKITKSHENCEIEEISESGRIFLRNLAYTCTEDDLETLFSKFGPIAEVTIPIDNLTRKSVGFGFVTFMMPEHALQAFSELDGTAFQGRMLHILPSKPKTNSYNVDKNEIGSSSYKKEKKDAEKQSSQSSHNWNSLFIGANAVADAISERYNESKSKILDSSASHSAAVRVAIGETQLVHETRQFLVDNGVSLDAFSQTSTERSKTVLIAKNLTVGSTSSELRDMFEKHAKLGRVLLAPAGTTALIECLESFEAKKAFTKLAYRQFHHKPLYLEWAPMDTFVKSYPENTSNNINDKAPSNPGKTSSAGEEHNAVCDEDVGITLFVKNLNFNTSEENMKRHFEKCGPLISCTISRKKTHKNNSLLSMGYGFVKYQLVDDGKKALKTLQHKLLDEHSLELKISERKVVALKKSKKQKETKQVSSKILVRNIPFQANEREISSLFKAFGEIKTVRLPKKMNLTPGQSGNHRGFAFVDYITKQDAKNAFESLCHSTHLYGRRLVLEWADTEEESVDNLRRKTSDHFHGNAKKSKGLGAFEESIGLE